MVDRIAVLHADASQGVDTVEIAFSCGNQTSGGRRELLPAFDWSLVAWLLHGQYNIVFLLLEL